MEIENKSISVWLVLKDGENRGKVALQKRSDNGQSFPFVCQATWAGKVEPGENLTDAIERECEEEMGKDFKDSFDFSKLELVSSELYTMKGENWKSYNYLAKLIEEDLSLSKMHNEAFREFVFVDGKDEINSLSSENNPKESIVLFDDQYKVLKNILNAGSRNK